MKRFQLASAVLLAMTMAVTIPQGSRAQYLTSGKTVTIRTDSFKFAKPVKRCIALCSDAIVERREFECAPFLAPPLTGSMSLDCTRTIPIHSHQVVQTNVFLSEGKLLVMPSWSGLNW